MACTSSQVTQNGNTTVTWKWTGSCLSTHEAIVFGLTSRNSSCIRIEYIDRCVNPTTYYIRVRVIGAEAVAFRAYSEQMD